ncbi:cupin-like domain-containing protein [Pseudoxanthomonas wuyuanensis]
MQKCFSGSLPAAMLDREPFKFAHQLVSHPALSIESLARSLPELPPDRIMYSKGLSDLGIHFDSAHIEHGNGLSLQQTIETIRTSSSYIAVKDPEQHPVFRGLYDDLLAEVGGLMRQGRKSRAVYEPRMWLFIASPNAQTPFHFDRYSNFLMQIRGSKQVAVFPSFDPNIVPPEACESYMDRVAGKPLWHPELDQYATKFDFSPGEAIHIPYIAGHYVKNGAEDVSISLSFFFQTDETLRWTRAMQFNHRLRKRMKLIGMAPTAVGHSRRLDTLKARLLPALGSAGRLVGRMRRATGGNPD